MAVDYFKRPNTALNMSARSILLYGAFASTGAMAQTDATQTMRTVKATADDDGVKANDQEGATKSPLSIRETSPSINYIGAPRAFLARAAFKF